MKILAFAGSNSSTSINRKLINFAISYCEANNEVYQLDLNDYEMPIFSTDREKLGYPEQAYRFREHMEKADCIILSLAEHNKSYAVAFKNIIDWCSRVDMDIFKAKPVLLMSTSQGAFGGGNVLAAAKTLLPKCNAHIVEVFSLPLFDKNFSDEEGIRDKELKAEFERKIEIFKDQLLPKL
jgi:chromate reductase, NAD(P)H dehydrogenase (quinone)